MAADPAIRYQGGVAGFAKTAPAKGERYDARSSQAQMYAERLGPQQDAVLARVGACERQDLQLSPRVQRLRGAHDGTAQAAKLRKDKTVLRSGKTARCRSTRTIRRSSSAC